MAAAKFDEGALGPIQIPAAWWYSLKSQDRRTILGVCATSPVGAEVVVGETYIGLIQDILTDEGHVRLARSFMRSMQKCLDASRSADAERQQILDASLESPREPMGGGMRSSTDDL